MTNINHLVKEERDLTQEKVAKLLKTSRQNYSIWETNTKFIPLKHLNNYCNVFNVSMGV
jgi:transcriptional regulator with XRE-family HTH domain